VALGIQFSATRPAHGLLHVKALVVRPHHGPLVVVNVRIAGIGLEWLKLPARTDKIPIALHWLGGTVKVLGLEKGDFSRPHVISDHIISKALWQARARLFYARDYILCRSVHI